MNTRVGIGFPFPSSLVAGVVCICLSLVTQPTWGDELDLTPAIQKNSPVLQRWLQEIPDVLKEIRHQPRFSSRVRLGYSLYPDEVSGWLLGVEDLNINNSHFTFSADYQSSPSGDYTAVGLRLQYYLLPLGKYINFAPVLGYRYLQTGDYSTSGVNVGARLVLALSSKGGADIFLTQSFIFSGDGEQVGITTASFGYAITSKVRISADIEQLNSRGVKDGRFSMIMEIVP
ncbi:hypothetical protein [Gloeocapsa sp. PCC 73106]|uniref:hypothetical protein n=1 Tax=Gloeocapsa sp. PCC 73106 TaxID=102232 RepID=UPI0002ACE985|nr:hypothetical protein [Gloeocapsa sp. PCC 73106]ELR99136.1 hypothetical protein GLO73106DRAFT_00029850 [Gloeocapsa sp. PCC 73106]